MNISRAGSQVERAIKRTLNRISKEVRNRGVRASNQLRNSVLHILAGKRSGRKYKIPGMQSTYTASAPGEAPANRTGTLRNSYRAHSYSLKDGNIYEVHSVADSSYKVNGYLLGDMLERGTKRIKPRPFKDATINRALPKVLNIYKRKY